MATPRDGGRPTRCEDQVSNTIREYGDGDGFNRVQPIDQDGYRRLLPKVSGEREAAFIFRRAHAGEPGVALTELAAILTEDQTSVTEADRDDLRRLLADLGEPVSNADRLNVYS